MLLVAVLPEIDKIVIENQTYEFASKQQNY